MAAAVAVSLLPATAYADPSAVPAEGTANDNLLRIWYDEPATDWQTEALAIGNGYMGALVYGGEKQYGTAVRQKITATDIITVIQTRPKPRKIFRRSALI